MKTKTLKIFIGLSVIICSCHEINRGIVVAKQCEPSHTESRYDVILKMPVIEYIPAKYYFIVRDNDKREYFSVNEITFDEFEINDSIILKTK